MKHFYKKKSPPDKKNVPTNQNQAVLTLLRGSSKCFVKAFKAFIKPFEAPQRRIPTQQKVFPFAFGFHLTKKSFPLPRKKLFCI